VSDAPLTKCPECGKAKYRKQLSAAGFQLKGTGWYATDFRGGAAKPAEKKKGDKKADSQADSKADSKSSDGKSEPKKPESKAAA
jgi:predicted nucleic acid-binding Zn ribbon protein